MVQSSRRRLARVAFAALALFSAPALGQDAREEFRAAATPFDAELRNARAMGMAGAFTGAGTGLGALYHNPAGILTVPVYEFDVGYQRTWGADGNAIGAGIVDAKTNPNIAAAFGYSFAFGNDENLRDAFRNSADDIDRRNHSFRDHDIRAALAFPVVPEVIALGVGMHYVNHFRGSWRQQVSEQVIVDVVDENGEPTGETEVQTQITSEDFELQYSGITLDAGLFASLSEQLFLGFAARNILEIDNWNRGRRFEAGIGGHFDSLHLEAGWFAEQDLEGTYQNGAAVGIEYTVVSAPLRLGYRYEAATEAHILASGAGFRSEKFGMDLAFEQNLANRSERRLGASILVFF